jgi:hypothetical protein
VEAGGSWVGEVVAETGRSRGRRNEHLWGHTYRNAYEAKIERRSVGTVYHKLGKGWSVADSDWRRRWRRGSG